MSTKRIVVVGAMIVAAFAGLVLLGPSALVEPSTAAIIFLRVVGLYLLAIGVGLSVQLVSLVRARVRLHFVRPGTPGETILVTVFWSRPLWRFLGLEQGPLASVRDWALDSATVAVDDAGISFWGGTTRPRRLHQIEWAQVKEVSMVGAPKVGRNFTGVVLHLTSGEHLPLQVASTALTLWPIAGEDELRRVSDAINAARPTGLEHPMPSSRG